MATTRKAAGKPANKAAHKATHKSTPRKPASKDSKGTLRKLTILRKDREPVAPPPAPAAPERDYLVIFEEPDPYGLPADDSLVLDIEQPTQQARPEVDVQQKVAVELSNTTSRLGTFGFGLASSGAALGVVLMVAFATVYPDNWHGHTGVIRTMILVAVVSMLLMIAGTVLTHYGRRIRASGRLSDVRIVEKSPQSKASLE